MGADIPDGSDRGNEMTLVGRRCPGTIGSLLPTRSHRRSLCALTAGLVLAGASRRAAAEAAETSLAVRDYRVAVAAGVALGPPGWGNQLGTLAEIGARAQLLPWLGAGVSYFQLEAGNNEGYPALAIRALELHAAAHPFRTQWLDPFFRIGAVRIVGVSDGYPGEIASVSRWGLEGVAGLSVTASYFALGLDLRHGFTNRSWTMLGLHLELRLPLP